MNCEKIIDWHSLQSLINAACLKFGRALLESCFLVEFGVKCSSLWSSSPPSAFLQCAPRLLLSGIISPRKSKPAARRGFQATFLLTVSSSRAKTTKTAWSRLIEKGFLEHWLHRLVTLRYSFQLAGLYHSSDRGLRTKRLIPHFKRKPQAAQVKL